MSRQTVFDRERTGGEMKFRFVLLFLLILCLTLACCQSRTATATLSINGRALIIEIARSREERTRGLMYRERLDWNAGMLFVFRKDQILSFWMKDTPIPLSVAFLDKDGKVTDIFHMEPYSLFPVRSQSMCRYALEVNHGFFEEAGLQVGDRIDLSDIPGRFTLF
jgi:hypothetical protein